MMIQRLAARRLKELASAFPVVTIEGPRQSGKTTLARSTFPGYAYANLEEYADRRLASEDPRGFLEKYPAPAIIDEVQRVPQLLSEIQAEVDGHEGNGRFILTGSYQPRLAEGIAQSLAGRTALMSLLPLSIAELSAAGITLERDEYIHRGFLPAIYDRNQAPSDAYEAYYRTYVERDVRQLVNLSHQREFEVFVRLLAGRVGQQVNLHSMAGDVGVSSTTLKEWLNQLEASFVVFRLQPWSGNYGKRMTKTPKIYFTDVGLAAHLLDIASPAQVMRDPLFGGLFENLVVLEALKAQCNAVRRPSLYYVRESAGLEVDLVVEIGRRLHLMEIKGARTPDGGMADNMARFRKNSGQGESAHVIYSGEDWPLNREDIRGEYLNFRDVAALLDGLYQERG